MSSSMATAAVSSAASTISSNATGGTQVPPNISASAAQFREIHKNTWLKRLTAEGKKVTVGSKRCERSWVVFCVHDDAEALLEGYAEPRQAASHSPEWIVSMQDTLHISHALIPNSHEFEFVVTLSNEVIRFHAMSWEIMQEWVETLRSKLREMKILSPRENLYTKLPEIRAPLLPTRDPTSPLPAPPPVPAALVPGVERVVPHSILQETVAAETIASEINGTVTATTATARVTSTAQTQNTLTVLSTSNPNNSNETSTASSAAIPVQFSYSHVMASHGVTDLLTTSTILTSMSNTLTQNLLNMLLDPISTYNEHLNGENAATEFASLEDSVVLNDGQDVDDDGEASISGLNSNLSDFYDEFLPPLLRKSSVNIQMLPGTSTSKNSENSVRVDISATKRTSADQIKNLENLIQCDRLIPRPQTSRSLSAGAADASRKQITHLTALHNEANNVLATSSSNNITEFEISLKPAKSPNLITTTTTQTSTITTATAASVAATTTDPKTNITIIQVSTNDDNSSSNAIENESTKAPKLPIKNITAEIFKFPETHKAAAATTIKTKQHEYKSNVQIIPSNLINSSTIQVLGQDNVAAPKSNQYSTSVKKNAQQQQQNVGTTLANSKITTVHVAGDVTATAAAITVGTNTVSVYGTCYTTATSTATSGTVPTSSQTQNQFTPKLPKKTILSANTSGITNIAVNNTNNDSRKNTIARVSSDSNTPDTVGGCDNTVMHNAGNVHYEKVFLSSSIPITTQATTAPNVDASASSTTSTNVNVQQLVAPTSPKVPIPVQWNSPRRQGGLSSSDTQTSSQVVSEAANPSVPASPTPVVNILKKQKSTVHTLTTSTPTSSAKSRVKSTQSTSAAAAAQLGASLSNVRASSGANLNQPPLPTRPPFLTRGLTEAVITTRPSRRDVHFLKLMPTKTKSHSSTKNAAATSNNNVEMSTSNVNALPMHAAVNRTNLESVEQRRRSSSTSDARNNTRGTNNNEFVGNRIVGSGCGVAGASGGAANTSLRIQQPPQPFRSVENNAVGNGVGSGMSPPPASPATTNSSPAAKRMTLREQQVMQLRREIMHPGGVRLQLRRKDCVGSIAWVDAFGAVWVAGWKQKEHPVLYNALHIGDQLLSIAGISVSSAAEANKIIRNSNTLFVEVLVRRIPFGRGYAIRREREGQCLGLIRDGNTSTIVDVVPNSLAARHGLPPKSQSCDGTTLTFWVLTEINGRPLNLFFKENEIRDRLNSVGRDISILVQPSDLITKLKKQLKSLRGYKDYLVQ